MHTRLISRPFTTSHPYWWALALLGVFIVLSFQYGHKAIQDRSAILRWRPQILQIDEIDIYQRYTYPNPPIMALVLKPVAWLPPMATSLCWFYLKVGMTFLTLFWVFRLVEAPGQVFPLWAQGLTVVLALRPILGDLSHGNVNLFILFLLVAALYAYRKGHDVGTGLLLALAIACKVTPALFVPYFLWKRAWKTLAGCALGLALFLFVVPGVFLGMNRNVQLLTSWYACMIRPFAVQGEVTAEYVNQSLPGLVYRLGSHSPSLYDREGRPLEYANVAELDRDTLRWFLKGCALVFAGVVVWSCRTPTQPRPGWRLAAEFSLVVLGMLLLSERTWKHHCVTLLLPFAVLVYCLAVCRPGPGLRAYLIATLAGAMLLMTATGSTGLSKRWDELAKQAQVGGAYVWAYVLLMGALAVLLRKGPGIVKQPGPGAFSFWTKGRAAPGRPAARGFPGPA